MSHIESESDRNSNSCHRKKSLKIWHPPLPPPSPPPPPPPPPPPKKKTALSEKTGDQMISNEIRPHISPLHSPTFDLQIFLKLGRAKFLVDRDRLWALSK